MNPAKCSAEDYINFVIAAPRVVTATEAECVQPISENAAAHDAFTRLLTRLEPDPETLWAESRPQVDLNRGILILDDWTLEKPYSRRNELVYRHWSGKQKAVVSGINLITLLWSEGDRCVPVDYRIFDKDRDRKTRNDHFSEMLLQAQTRGFNPQMVCFDGWYASWENLKLCCSLGWHFLTRLKRNRLVNPDRTGLRAACLCRASPSQPKSRALELSAQHVVEQNDRNIEREKLRQPDDVARFVGGQPRRDKPRESKHRQSRQSCENDRIGKNLLVPFRSRRRPVAMRVRQTERADKGKRNVHIVITARSPRPSGLSAHALRRLVMTLNSKNRTFVEKTNLTLRFIFLDGSSGGQNRRHGAH